MRTINTAEEMMEAFMEDTPMPANVFKTGGYGTLEFE
jgi:hypothetical protein